MQSIIGFIIPIVVVILLFWWFTKKPKPKSIHPVPSNLVPLLQEHVRFYRRLDKPEQERFVKEVENFLGQVTVEAVGTEVEDIDKALIAASAVIPIFNFSGWRYRNLTNVILYPDTFDEQYQFKGERRNIMGMVGSGALNGQMLLSRSALRDGFLNEHDKHNTGIHEFVHLVDKTDGSVDGFPESLLRNSYSLPWLKVMHEEIRKIETGQSDINPYAAMNQAEFLAVTSEYFFERPDQMEEHHPELFALLSRMFNQPNPSGVPAGSHPSAANG